MTSTRLRVTGGVDTHADVHVAAILDSATGRLLATASFDTTVKGYVALIDWMTAVGDVDLVGIESTGSYGAGLNRSMVEVGIKVVEVDRTGSQSPSPSRQDRHCRRHRGGTCCPCRHCVRGTETA